MIDHRPLKAAIGLFENKALVIAAPDASNQAARPFYAQQCSKKSHSIPCEDDEDGANRSKISGENQNAAQLERRRQDIPTRF